jgi:glyoxylase-like metal-dependent hydrolase (beta-lactamase superfamily II)
MNSSLPFVPDMKTRPEVKEFFDQDTETFSYVVKDPGSSACAVVDCVLNIDYASGTISYEGADAIIAYIREHKLELQWLIETHVHADHLTAAPYIQEQLGGKTGIGDKINTVQEVFAGIFNTGDEFKRDGSQFDRLFTDGDSYQIGMMTAYAMHTPGHTPACMTHVIGDAAFVGDTLFMPDVGTARADFPGGNARTLYESIMRVLALPDETRLYMCHDYPESRDVECLTTVAAEKLGNIHVHEGVNEDQYVVMREARDSTLDMPRLILPSLQVNMRAGHLPPAEDNGMVYLKLPINAFK